MTLFNHIAIALTYALVATTAALSLPNHFGIEPRLGGEIGAAILIAGAMVHFALSRLAHDRWVATELARMAVLYGETRSELAAARQEAWRIHEAIEAASLARQGQVADIDAVMTEVKVLQDLVERLQNGGSAAPPAPAPETRSAPPREPAPRQPPKQVPERVISGLDNGALLDVVRDGLRNNRVELFIQPIVSLPQRKHRHYECFSRIRAADGGIITPEQYLAIAEGEGLVGAIDNMLLFRSVQLIRRIQKRSEFGLFLNISDETLADADFFREFVAFLSANRELAPRLVFEFPQANVARLARPVLAGLDQLARLGFRFSMDQVSDLNLDVAALGARNFRFLKIEASRLLEATQGSGTRLDMKAFKRALDRSGIDLIIEKIESDSILVELLDLPIDLGQGFLFGEPRPARQPAGV